MSYQHCLAALARNGASTEVKHLVAMFLTNRTMTVKVAGVMSSPLPVSGGCPQGSILGVFLFNATIDDLEAGCPDLGLGNERADSVSSSKDTLLGGSAGARRMDRWQDRLTDRMWSRPRVKTDVISRRRWSWSGPLLHQSGGLGWTVPARARSWVSMESAEERTLGKNLRKEGRSVLI